MKRRREPKSAGEDVMDDGVCCNRDLRFFFSGRISKSAEVDIYFETHNSATRFPDAIYLRLPPSPPSPPTLRLRTQGAQVIARDRDPTRSPSSRIPCTHPTSTSDTDLLTSPQCAPAVAEFTASRKRSWAAKVLAGRPSLPAYQDLFVPETYDDINSIGAGDDQTFLTCSPVRETHIQNNTCVLAPEVTEGPYYHSQAHLIRQNIAEWQDGLLLVSRKTSGS